MPLRKVIITNGTSCLGKALIKIFKTENNWETFAFTSTTSTNEYFINCDFRDKEFVKNILQKLKPDVVIHCPSINPEQCEKDPNLAEFFHVTCTDILTQICSKIGSWFLLISSDWVFDGLHPPYSSNAELNPLNTFGKTFKDGETILWKNQPDAGILRVPLVYGKVEIWEETLVSQIVKILLDGGSSTLDDIQIRYPTYAEDIAIVCRGLAERKLEHCGLYGTWHWSGLDGFTAYSLGVEIANIMGKPHHFISSKVPNLLAPQNCQLNCIALSVMGLGRHTPLKEGIIATVESLK